MKSLKKSSYANDRQIQNPVPVKKAVSKQDVAINSA